MVSVARKRDGTPMIRSPHDSTRNMGTRWTKISRFLRSCCLEMCLSILATGCCTVLLSCLYGPVRSAQPLNSVRVHAINIVLFTTWRHYVVCRFVKDSFIFYGPAFFGMCAFPLQQFFAYGFLDKETGDPTFFSMFCAECLGFCGIFTGLVVCTDIVSSLCSLVRKTSSPIQMHQDKTRDSLLVKLQFRFAFVLILTSLLTLIGSKIALDDPVVNKVTVEIPHLSMENEGTRIIHISDLHIGITVGKTRCQKTVDLVNQVCNASCSVIALTGDIVDADPEEMEVAISPLRQLDSAPLKLFVTGNHEHIHGEVEGVVSALSKLGISHLANQHVRLGGQLVFAGVYDKSAPKFTPHLNPNVKEALKGTIPGKDVVVLLAHQPNHFSIAQAHGVDLQLSGHTHAGQVFPFTMGAWLFNRKFAGYYPRTRGTSTAVYVSAGTHWFGPPMRFTTHHHEITEITLRRG